MKPIVKWAGGKYKLAKDLKDFLPKDLGNIENYFEPFFGGGGFLFYNSDIFSNMNIYISDINENLISMYYSISKDKDFFINELDNVIQDFYNTRDKKAYYYNIRSKYNTEKDLHKKSVYLLFLNKTCFNGLYRENSRGIFNVPMGSYKTYSFYDNNNIDEISKFLKKAHIFTKSYKEVEVKPNSFYYIDPPYVPISDSSYFSNYNRYGFNINDQIGLLKMLYNISEANSLFMLSNSYCEYTLKLYEDFNISVVKAGRSINSKSDKRQKIQEIIVRNYKRKSILWD